MTTFPNSPRLMKGAIVGIDLFNPLASVIVFQYNPDTMTRTLQAQTSAAARGTAPRCCGSRARRSKTSSSTSRSTPPISSRRRTAPPPA